MKNFIASFLLTISLCFGDVLSTTGKIQFDAQLDGQPEMILNSTGLGIGALPSANLYVNGNVMVSEQLRVGGSSGSSNLSVNGTVGYDSQIISANAMLGENSVVLVDSSSDNIVLTLPYAGNVSGRVYNIKKISLLNSVWISGAGNLIDDTSPIELAHSTTVLSSVKVMSDGRQWYIVGSKDLSATVAADNLVGWWKLDDAFGTTAVDSSSSNLDATLSGGLDFSLHSVAGKIKSTLLFDNINDSMIVADNSVLKPVDFTISVWLKLNSLSSYEGIVSQTSSNYGAGGYFMRRDSTAEGGRFSVFIYDGGTPEPRASSTTVPVTGQWYHVVATFNEKELKIYVNGNLEGTRARVASISYGTGGNFIIGAVANGFPFPGLIDDMRVYNIALTSNEIQALYQQGL